MLLALALTVSHQTEPERNLTVTAPYHSTYTPRIHETVTPTPIATATPIPVTPTPTIAVTHYALITPPIEINTNVELDFFTGYRDAGGIYDEARVWRTIQCESKWNVHAIGAHYGLAQFALGTWERVASWTGKTDYTNAYHQGYNVATWANKIAPGSRAGWPVCWWS